MLRALKEVVIAVIVVIGSIIHGNGGPHAAKREKDGDKSQDLRDEFRHRGSVLQDGEERCRTRR